MSEPTTTSAVVISAGTITLSGSLLGMGYDVLIFGSVGVLFTLRMLPPMSRIQLAVAVITTTVLAALAAVLAGNELLSISDFLSTLPEFSL